MIGWETPWEMVVWGFAAGLTLLGLLWPIALLVRWVLSGWVLADTARQRDLLRTRAITTDEGD